MMAISFDDNNANPHIINRNDVKKKPRTNEIYSHNLEPNITNANYSGIYAKQKQNKTKQKRYAHTRT